MDMAGLRARLALETEAHNEARQYDSHGVIPRAARSDVAAAADRQRRLEHLHQQAAHLHLPGSRASLAPTARRKPPSAAQRYAWRLALGAVIVLNGITAICWPAVVELIGSYR